MQKDVHSISLEICDYTDTPLCSLYSSGSDISGQAYDVIVHTERNGFKELRFNIPSKCFEVVLDSDGNETGTEEVDNYRLQYLINDYRIRLISKKAHENERETDWFLISESKVTHNAFSQSYEIKASHISYLLNTKNLDLEFSDDEGNNTGTIEQIAETILEGTGWHIGIGTKKFYEEDKYITSGQRVEKVRSFSAAAKTGAFKMMSDLCEMFDAKPLYHGAGQYHVQDENGNYLYDQSNNPILETGRTVDIVPINPFSKDLEPGAVPQEVLEGENVLALYYDKNISNVSRTLNTDSLVTKMYAYGSYGDQNGACTLQNATHAELTFSGFFYPGIEYQFEWLDGYYYFTPTTSLQNVVWSYLDMVSRTYVYQYGSTTSKIANVYREPKTTTYMPIDYTVEYVRNYFPYVMDFSYYQKINLLTPAMQTALANFQIYMPAYYKKAQEAAEDMIASQAELTKTASSGSGFACIDILSSTLVGGYATLTLNMANNDAIIFRSDYDEAERNYFSWNTATGIKKNGDPINGKGSVIYIVRQNNDPNTPTTWCKAFVKALGDGTNTYYCDELGNNYRFGNSRINTYTTKNSFPSTGNKKYVYVAGDTKYKYAWVDDDYVRIREADYDYASKDFTKPTTVTLWSTENFWQQGDKVYLFSANDIASVFGPREDEITSNKDSTEASTKKGSTETHPVDFLSDGESVDPASLTTAQNTYGWYYVSHYLTYSFGDLYFCWGENGDVDYSHVYVSFENIDPEELLRSNYSSYGYFYSIARSMLYTPDATEDKWVPLGDSTNEKYVKQNFATVIDGCIRHETALKGFKEQYYYTFPSNDDVLVEQHVLPQGNYAIKSEFGTYWLFTTDRNIDNRVNGQVRYYTDTRVIWQDLSDEHIITPVEYSFKSLTYPKPNELTGMTYTSGSFANETFSDEGTSMISKSIPAFANVKYYANLPADSIAVFLNKNSKYVGQASAARDGDTAASFITHPHTKFIKVVIPNRSTTDSTWYLHVGGVDKNVFTGDEKEYRILSCTSPENSERLGLPYLMDKFIRLSNEVYLVKLPILQEAQNQINKKTNELMLLLGDMYREGYWQENSYVEGEDETRLYTDALDNLKEVSHPQATYEFNYLDLYGADKHVGLSEDELSEQVDWPDVEITDAAHLVDTDIDTNCWAYIDSIDKCYDQPWKTQLEINTRLSMIGQQSFTDVLARIAEVANEVKGKQTLYQRSSALSGSGRLAAERLEGAIKANRLLITGGNSSWHTDEKGNILFEATDGSAAMMLTGQGWAISNQKDEYGDWIWRYMATGLGITADAIYTGYLSAERIEAGSVTTDKLSSTVGEELEISSNKALMLYATTDGKRPAGALETVHPASGDSYIKIAAKSGSNPAYIDIQSGGKVNIYSGSSMNIESNGLLNITGGQIQVTSQGQLNITSSGKFILDSDNLKVKSNGNVEITGKVTATSGEIAGFTIASAGSGSTLRQYIYAGSTNSVTKNANGVYIGTDGINVAGKFMVKADGTSTILKTSANDIYLGEVTIGSTLSGIEGKADTAQTTADSKAKTFRDSIANMRTKTYSVGDIFRHTNTFAHQYVCYHVTAKSTRNDYSAAEWWTSNTRTGHFLDDWELTGTAITGGAALEIDANAGTIDMVAANSITMTAGATISIAASKQLSLTTAGTIVIGNGVKPFTIGATTGTDGHAYMYNGVTSMSDTTHNGVYVGTDGIRLGKGKFSVGTDGVLTATGADISGTVTATSGEIGAWTVGSNYIGDADALANCTIGMRKGTSSAQYVFFAGANGSDIATASFYVTKGGKLKSTNADIQGAITATSGSIGTWTIGENYIGDAAELAKCTIGVRKGTSSGNYVFFAGADGSAITTAPFHVTKAGKLVATDAEVKGKITADSLYIGSNNLVSNSKLSLTQSNCTIASALIDISGKSITMSQVSDWESNAYKIQSNITMASGGITLKSTASITMNSGSISLSGGSISMNGGSITLTSSGNGITLNKDKIELSTANGKLILNGREFTKANLFARDDIIILKNGDNESTVISNHSSQHDWVMIKPFYNGSATFINDSYTSSSPYQISSSGSIKAFADVSEAEAFGNGGSYNYTFTGKMQSATLGTFNLTLTLGLNTSLTSSVVTATTSVNHSTSTGQTAFTFTVSNSNINLCQAGKRISFKITCSNSATITQPMTLTCASNTATSRVPCNVYYFP